MKPYFEKYDMVFNSEVSSAKSNSAQNNNNGNTTHTSNNNTKMNNYSKRLNNELQKMNIKTQTRTKPKVAVKEKKCNEIVAKSIQKEERKAKRKKHKHIRRGKKEMLNNYPILYFDNFWGDWSKGATHLVDQIN